MKAVLVTLTGTVIPQVTIKQMPADVAVLDRMDIPRVFKRAREQMMDRQLEQVFAKASCSAQTLWR